MTDRGICVVTHPLSSSGENATRTLLDILAAIAPVSLVTANLPENSTIWEDRTVVEVSTENTGDSVFVAAFRFLRNQIRMCLAIRDRPEEIVLFFGATSYVLPIVFARAIGKTVLVEPRGDVPLTLRLKWEQRMPAPLARGLAGLVRLLERVGFALAHRVVTYTPSMARELGLDPESPKVYPHGARYVDTERFSVQTPFEEREDVVGFVGRLDEEKGIRELAKVAKQLPEGVTFRFVGDGPLFDWLAEELREEIASGDVELAGWVDHDDVPEELNRMKLLVMPSQPTEGLPTTILESMACGTPVLATPVSGVPDVVRDGETGFHLVADTPDELAAAIRDALERPDLAETSTAGRRLVKAEYSREAAIQRYREILTRVTA